MNPCPQGIFCPFFPRSSVSLSHSQSPPGSRGGELYVFADVDAGFADEAGVHVLSMPHTPEIMQPVIYTVALQLLAYHVALQKGTDVDKPRNLAKSVTVE